LKEKQGQTNDPLEDVPAIEGGRTRTETNRNEGKSISMGRPQKRAERLIRNYFQTRQGSLRGPRGTREACTPVFFGGRAGGKGQKTLGGKKKNQGIDHPKKAKGKRFIKVREEQERQPGERRNVKGADDQTGGTQDSSTTIGPGDQSRLLERKKK